LPETFKLVANALLEQHPHIPVSWEQKGSDGCRLKISRLSHTGFDVVVEAESYGLYPFAGEWHGGAWELVSKDETEESLCIEMMGFVRSLLCLDSTLEVSFAGGKPYKWTLTYPTTRGTESHTTGLLFYNYFSSRSVRRYANEHLPQRNN
jgi:hypothetical protein